MKVEKRIVKTLAALALVCGLSLSARAQIGTGWTPTTEGYYIQTSANCTAVPSNTSLGGTFSVPSGSGRAEFRFEDLATTGQEQFQGTCTINSLGGTGINIKQLFGPAPSTPWVIIEIMSGGEIRDLETGTHLGSFTVGVPFQVNTIYDPVAQTVQIAIGGSIVATDSGHGPPNYNKFGAYVSASGSGPCTDTWSNVQMWIKGQTGGYYITDVAGANGTISPTTGFIGPLNAGSNATVTFTPNSGFTANVYIDNVLVATGTTSYTFNNIQASHMIYVAFTQGTQVATPIFSPGAGTYTSAQAVTISDSTSGASIRYTTDGSTPTSTTGTLYSGPVTINTTTTLKAIGFKSGDIDSAIASALYTITLPQCAAPTYSPAAGTYTGAQSVTISTTTSGASIRYTTDGSTPSETAGTLYSSPVSISSTATLKAIAFESGFSDSTVTSGTYTINLPQCAAPTFNPLPGTYSSAQSVSISTTTGGASINYTTDGSTPTETHGTLYTGPIAVNSTTTIQAIAFESGFSDSAVVSGTYTITLPQCAAPTYSPAAGTYTGAQSVTISTTTSGASIRYTTDGSTPSETAGTLYSSPVSISSTATLKAVAYKSGFSDSNITSGTYTINLPQCAAPTFNPVAGTYTSAQSVTISTTTSGASIRYTTDGSTPSETAGTLYSSPVSINSTTTLKAIAFESGFSDSTVTSGTYTINIPQVATPTFSPGGGSYSTAQTVTISDTTSGASIRYTTDGSTPSETAGTIYSGPVSIGVTTTLKAIAYESGFADSSIASATYTIGGGTLTGSSGDGFHNLTINPAATGSFTATFDAKPTVSPENAVVGLSSGAATAYGNLGCIVRFNTSGQIDAYSGSGYISSTINYSANISYHFRLAVNLSNHTYAAYVTPAGGSELTIGTSLAFRSTANTMTSLNNWSLDVNSSPSGCSLTATGLAVSGGVVAAPTFSPGGGTYNSPQNVTISTTTSGASIRYTTDGSTPSETAGTLYSGAVSISVTTTLKAIAYESGMTDSSVTSATYSGMGAVQVATPTFNPGAGTYTSVQSVTISTTTSGASIRYTTDGSTPSETNGTLYSAPVSINSTTTLQAIAYESGDADSNNATALYTINIPAVAAPTFSPAAGTYTSAQSVTISTTTSGASIRYTLDGSTPSETAGTLYSGPINISATTTLKAIAYESGFSDSTVTSGTYTIASNRTLTGSSGNGWHALAISPGATGTFTATYDATPSIAPENAVVGLSNGAATAFGNLGCIGRFNPSGQIDAYSGSGYVSSTINYSAGVSYHFRFVVNVTNHTYSAYVTPAGGSELTIGTNLAFRSTANTMTSLTDWNLYVDPSIGGATLTANNLTP